MAPSFSRRVGGIALLGLLRTRKQTVVAPFLPLCRLLREAWTTLVRTRPLLVSRCYRGCLPLQIVSPASRFRAPCLVDIAARGFDRRQNFYGGSPSLPPSTLINRASNSCRSEQTRQSEKRINREKFSISPRMTGKSLKCLDIL